MTVSVGRDSMQEAANYLQDKVDKVLPELTNNEVGRVDLSNVLIPDTVEGDRIKNLFNPGSCSSVN